MRNVTIKITNNPSVSKTDKRQQGSWRYTPSNVGGYTEIMKREL